MAPPPNSNPSVYETLALMGYFLVIGLAIFLLGMYYKRRGK